MGFIKKHMETTVYDSEGLTAPLGAKKIHTENHHSNCSQVLSHDLTNYSVYIITFSSQHTFEVRITHFNDNRGFYCTPYYREYLYFPCRTDYIQKK